MMGAALTILGVFLIVGTAVAINRSGKAAALCMATGLACFFGGLVLNRGA